MKVGAIPSYIDIKKFIQSQRTEKTHFQLSNYAASKSAPASSTQVSISDAAKDAASGSAVRGTQGGYRILDPSRGRTIRDVVASGRPIPIIMLPAKYIAEANLHDEQVKARETANYQYALQHHDKLYGQVLVKGANGKDEVFATVFDSGVSTARYAVKVTEEGFGTSLAKTRLKEIAEAVGGRIVYSNFLPDPFGGFSARGAPDELLPKVTARSSTEIFAELKQNNQLAAYTITITSVEQYDAFHAGNFTSVQQWNEYLQNQSPSQPSNIDTSS